MKKSDFFKPPLPPKQNVIIYSPTPPPSLPPSLPPLQPPPHTITKTTLNAAQAYPLFPTQSPSTHINYNTTTTTTTSLNHTFSPQPKIQNAIQRPSSNNNILEWSNNININMQNSNNCNQLKYGQQNNNFSYSSHSFVKEFTEFVIKTSPVQTIKSCTNIDQYASPKINRRSSTSNNSTTTTTTTNSSSSSSNNNNNDPPPASSTIICNNRRKLKNNNSSNSNNSSTSSNKMQTHLLNGKKLISSPNVTTSAIINNCSGNNNNDIISLNSRNMQVLLKRCKTIPTTATATTTNNFLPQTLTLPGRGIVLKQQTHQPETYVIEDEIDADEEDEELEENDAAIHLSRTAQILRKFRIPKTTALLPKMVAANNKCLISADELSAGRSVLSVETPTPPPTVGTPNSTSSSVGFLEEVIESVEEDDMQDDSEAVIIETPLTKEEDDEFVTEETYLTDDALLATTNNVSNIDNGNSNTVVMNANNSGAFAPLQLQTLQPNGAITCINLPPNTILLSAADGTILATTAPAGNSNSNKLIALQDWHSNGSNVGVLPQNPTTILQQSMAAASAANELLKTQVLA